MSAEWRRIKVRDFGRIVTGKTPPTSRNDFFGGLVPFLTPTDMPDGQKYVGTDRMLTDAGLASVKNCLIPKGVAVSCIGWKMGKTNATLEAIAQALFKSWFVDFDPVRAKLEGHAPEGMDEATAALFPDSFEESELGLVPKGWRVQSFRETIHIIGGGTPKTSNPDFWGGDIPWFSVVDAPAVSDVFVIDTEKHITEAGLNGSSTKLLPTGTTIISARGTVGRLALTGCPMSMNQSWYGLRGLAGDSYFTYFSTKRLVEQLKQRAHGSVFDTITQESFAGVLVCFPSEGLITVFEDCVGSLMLRIRENLIQAQTLPVAARLAAHAGAKPAQHCRH